MHRFNYNHLFYFWVVAREGSLVAAGKTLRLSHPTLSTQIKTLEEAIGEKLFRKVGRKLVLTEAGQTALRYAEEIFALGREMSDSIQGHATGQPARLHIGIADVVPKLVVRQLLQPALTGTPPVHIVCYEDSHQKLLADLALHKLHVVISDEAVPSGSPIRAFNHPLGETDVSLFASPSLAKKFKRGFPSSLTGAPFLLPLEHLTLRRSINRWFGKFGIKPVVVAEFEDSALFKVFGAEGVGIFPAPTVIEKEVIQQFGVEVVGRAEGVREQFFAVTLERKMSHPAVMEIADMARNTLFS